MERLDRLAGRLGQTAQIALRVNPDVDAGTHPYISTGLRENKFGIAIEEALALYRRAAQLPNLELAGLACHIGSQLTALAPFLDAIERLLALAARLRDEGMPLRHLDIGGGLGIRYRDERPPEPAEYAAALRSRLAGCDYEVLLEPGRAIAGNAGVLLTRVEYLKSNQGKHFAIVDGAMNDLLRPALYDAFQEIVPVRLGAGGAKRVYDVVGPVCETADFLGKGRELILREGDLLAVRSAGAYGFSMSSNYNSRPRAAEVLVDGDRFHLVRRREELADLFRGEMLPS